MRGLEKGAPAAAILAAFSTIACCVPLGFLGAFGAASLSIWAQRFRPWLLGASVLFLVVGSVQLYGRPSACARRSKASVAIFWIAVAAVILVALFPQLIATLIAH